MTSAFHGFRWNIEEYRRVRNAPGLVAEFDRIGEITVDRSNAELHAAQAARKQPQEDGYTYDIHSGGDRARLIIAPTTARAQAHEAVNHAILKNLPIGTPPIPAPNREVPRELGERGAAMRQRNAAMTDFVRRFLG